MAINRRELSEHLLRLKGNAHFEYYVSTIENVYNSSVETLLNQDHPDEALRGECRAYLRLLKTIVNNTKDYP